MPIKAEVGDDAAPVAVAWSTDPDKEQFKDHDDVKISCSVSLVCYMCIKCDEDILWSDACRH